MIRRLTKIQLIAFVIVTVLGAAYVGGRYAQVDRIFVDRTYPVTVDLADSGGIFVGAEVTYRGIAVGKVGNLKFTDSGVQARIDIENSAPKIPADLKAVVANKSAIGEQYMDLQPRSTTAPYLAKGTRIAQEDTQIPLDTKTLLVNLQGLVGSVDTSDLKTVVNELGQAFEGTGPQLGTIMDTASSFITDAQENLGVTRQLLQDSSTVLATQIDKGSEIQAFSRDLALLSDTLVAADPDLRRLLDEGGDAADVIDVVVAENSVDLSVILADLKGPSQVAYQNAAGLQAIFLLYPYLVQGTYTVASPTEDGEYNAAFGSVFGGPQVCGPNDGTYTKIRNGRDIADIEFRTDLGCNPDSPLIRRNSDKSELNRAAVAGASSKKDQLAWLLMGPTG